MLLEADGFQAHAQPPARLRVCSWRVDRGTEPISCCKVHCAIQSKEHQIIHDDCVVSCNALRSCSSLCLSVCLWPRSRPRLTAAFIQRLIHLLTD